MQQLPDLLRSLYYKNLLSINYLPMATKRLYVERKDMAVIASALILLYIVNFK